MKNAIELRDELNNKRKEYMDSLNFDNLYFEINNRLENVSLFESYIAITYEEIFEYLDSDLVLEHIGNKELKKIINITLDSIALKLKSLKYIVTHYYDPTIILKHKIGIKIYWDPQYVPKGADEL